MKTNYSQLVKVIRHLFATLTLALVVTAAHATGNEFEPLEETIPMQEWMMDWEAFNTMETEETLTIQPWMTDYTAFNRPMELKKLLADNSTEEEVMPVELWMTDLGVFMEKTHQPLLAIDKISFESAEVESLLATKN